MQNLECTIVLRKREGGLGKAEHSQGLEQPVRAGCGFLTSETMYKSRIRMDLRCRNPSRMDRWGVEEDGDDDEGKKNRPPAR
jgi:hypothetical protein